MNREQPKDETQPEQISETELDALHGGTSTNDAGGQSPEGEPFEPLPDEEMKRRRRPPRFRMLG